MNFTNMSVTRLCWGAMLVSLVITFGTVQIARSVVPTEQTSMPQTFHWHRTKHECKHYVMDTTLPLEGRVSQMLSLRPEDYIIMGHPVFYRIHANPVAEETVIEMGYWNLTIWASNRKAGQHFLVALYVWNSTHDHYWSSEDWNTGTIDAPAPEEPVKLAHSFHVGGLTIPEGGFFGFVIKAGTDGAVNFFFDSTIHDTKLVTPPSRPLFPGYKLETVTYTSTLIVPILVTQTGTTKITATHVTTQPVTVQTTALETVKQTTVVWIESTETRMITPTSVVAIGIGIAVAAVGIIVALLARRRPRGAPPAERPSGLF